LAPVQRRALDWLALAEWFGSGLAPLAPGFFGSVAALPLFALLRGLPPLAYWAVTAGLSALGTLAAGRAAVLLGEKDPQRVVIDEVTGVLIALGCVQTAGLVPLAVGFVAFRVLDVTKPGPIDRVQHLRPPALGIMADDWLAGALAGGLAALTRALLGA
jgi:phosphatidylglycerophosphatase A